MSPPFVSIGHARPEAGLEFAPHFPFVDSAFVDVFRPMEGVESDLPSSPGQKAGHACHPGRGFQAGQCDARMFLRAALACY